MNRVFVSLVATTVFLCANSLQATEQKASTTIKHVPYTAIYQAVYKSFPLQATHRLAQTGDNWYFSSIASGFFGQIEENSTFIYTEKGIAPLHYVYQRSVLGQERGTELIYNQKDKVAAGSAGKKKFDLSLKGEELDQGTYILALRDDVARGIKEPCYNVIDDDVIKPFCFRVTGSETIDTALGKIDTVVVERIRKPQSPRYTRFWFAPSLDYSIAKLEHQEQKGKTAYSLEITYYKREDHK
ncbi:MAG TPA: DUF3108 domain-containing protein [Pseudomonadales bacterium]|nr:DUF3108 domain-containing protein [Pseudomonadales bacterium]